MNCRKQSLQSVVCGLDSIEQIECQKMIYFCNLYYFYRDYRAYRSLLSSDMHCLSACTERLGIIGLGEKCSPMLPKACPGVIHLTLGCKSLQGHFVTIGMVLMCHTIKGRTSEAQSSSLTPSFYCTYFKSPSTSRPHKPEFSVTSLRRLSIGGICAIICILCPLVCYTVVGLPQARCKSLQSSHPNSWSDRWRLHL